MSNNESQSFLPDLDSLRMQNIEMSSSSTEVTHNNVSKRKVHGEFLRGPVSMKWLGVAARLKGKALAVGIALWFKDGATRNSTIKTSPLLWKKLGIHRNSASRALKALEEAGLVIVEHRPGQTPLVTILQDNNQD